MTDFREKISVPVRLLTAIGETHEGVVYLEPQQRLIDMLNDGSPAFMFREGESVHVMMKRHVASVEVLPLRRKAAQRRGRAEPGRHFVALARHA